MDFWGNKDIALMGENEKMRFVSVSSCRPRGGCPPSAEGGFWGEAEPLRPFGPPPLSGEAFGAGATLTCPCGFMVSSVRVTFSAYARSKRQGVPAAVYGQSTECHRAEPKETPVVSPREGSDPSDGWGQLWGPGASLSYMENLAGPRAALPTLPERKVGRPSADGRNAL